MPTLRTSTALRQLADLGHQPDPPRWSWAMARLEPTGRLVLPLEARDALHIAAGDRNTVRGICHRDALVMIAPTATLDTMGDLLGGDRR